MLIDVPPDIYIYLAEEKAVEHPQQALRRVLKFGVPVAQPAPLGLIECGSLFRRNKPPVKFAQLVNCGQEILHGNPTATQQVGCRR